MKSLAGYGVEPHGLIGFMTRKRGLCMIFYDLRCLDCNAEHNIAASMAEKAEKRIACPDCGSFEMETVFKSPPAFVKGSSPSVQNCPNQSSCGVACGRAG